MDLRRLRQFAVVADEGNVTRAAARLGMQQAPLSQQIMRLEREIGAQLLVRKPRGVELTEAGRALDRAARSIFAQIDEALATTRRAARGEEGVLRVGLTSSACFHAFPPTVIRSFRASYPHVTIQFEQASTPGLIEQLKGERIDAAFIRTTLDPPEAVRVTALVDEPMIVALPSRHALAKARSARMLTLKALARETFIGYPRSAGAGLYDSVIAACMASGFSPRIGYDAPQIVSTLSLVAAGLGISIVPQSMQRVRLGGVVYRSLSGPRLPRAHLNLATMRNVPAGSPVHAFRRLAEDAALSLARDRS